MPDKIANRFLNGIMELKVNQSQTNNIFRLATNLVHETNVYCRKQITENSCDPLETLDASNRMISSELRKFDSDHKRQISFKKQESYVEPVEYEIGTHWETRRDKDSKIKMDSHVQSTFSYVPLLDIIKPLFKDTEFRKMYFEYNESKKHTCEDGVYKDFCCGQNSK